MLRFLARFLAVVLAAMFVVAAVVAIFLRPIGTKMLDPQTYKDVVREERVAERLPELVADTLAKSVTAGKTLAGGDAHKTGDVLGFLSNFSREDMELLLGAVLPADYVGAQLDGVIDQSFEYVNSEAERPVLKISVVDLKQRLAGGVLEDAYLQMLQTKPVCDGDPGLLPVACCPPDDQLPMVRQQFREKIVPSVTQLPDTFDLFAQQPSTETEQVYLALAKIRSRLRTYATVAKWSWVLPVSLLIGVTVFGVRSGRGLLLWWGVPCLCAGSFAVLFALPSAALGTWMFTIFIEPQLPAEAPVLAIEFLLGLVTTVARVLFGSVLKTSLLLVLGGGGALVLSFFIKTKPKAAPVPTL